MIKFMEVSLRLAGKAETLATINNATEKHSVRIATANPEFILEAQKNASFRKALESSFCTIDGFGLQAGLRLWRLRDRSIPFIERYQGADLVEDLLRNYQDGKRSFYLLGSGLGTAKAAAQQWLTRYPQLKIVGAEDGGIILENSQINEELASRIKQAKPDILLVAFGMPKQEIWMHHAMDLKVPVMIGVGGTFDFYVKKKRAPQLWRSLKLEWLYRVFSEKGHWRRAWRATVVYGFTLLKNLATEKN